MITCPICSDECTQEELDHWEMCHDCEKQMCDDCGQLECVCDQPCEDCGYATCMCDAHWDYVQEQSLE